jgi:ethanolamine permease
LCLVAAIAIVSAAFAPSSTMVVFIFLISVSHALLLAAFLRLRRREPNLPRPYRALGGSTIAAIALVLSLSVMVSCYQLEVRALTIAILVIALLTAHFLLLHPARPRGK